ncbi:MAG TPA: SDR family oxidoreductase [Steroidobacteraceae bacterium]|nr:SDR family oxidoreductase [Steroidobacteraceae bacterium]
MKVLVTGVNGYIGTVLAPYLTRHGHEVAGLDTGYYRDGWLYSANREFPSSPSVANKDLRAVTAADLEGFDAIVHLAELSNDPLGENRREVTFKINHEGSVALARLARSAGIERFVYTSSCSVYGAGTGEFLDERTAPNPQTAYAECKVRVERDVGALAGRDFCPVFLRNATAYGPSPRMRFDIVINDLCALAFTRRKIAMLSDGSPWRPVVHIEDFCEAIRLALGAPADAVRGEIMNVGDTRENYRVRELAEIIASVFPGCEVSVGTSRGDNRSYRVNFDKIRRILPEFSCRWNARRGVEQLRELFERIQLSPERYEFRAFTRLKQLKHLLSTGQLDGDLYWRH